MLDAEYNPRISSRDSGLAPHEDPPNGCPPRFDQFAVGEVAPGPVAEAHAGFRTPILTRERQGYLILAGIAAVLLTLLGGTGWGLWRTVRWWRGRGAAAA